MNIKAVLFDCDGLMFETEIIANMIWQEAARTCQKELPEDFFQHITGSGGQQTQDYLKSLGFEDIQEFVGKRRFNLDFWRSIQKDCLNKTGLIELFQYLEKENYKVAICSSSDSSYVQTLVNQVSYPLRFAAIVGGNMVTRAKPAPDIFLLGAQALSVKPEECLVLEDSKVGILAAKAAGMQAVFIEDTIAIDKDFQDEIDFQCETLKEVILLLKEKNDAGKLETTL